MNCFHVFCVRLRASHRIRHYTRRIEFQRKATIYPWEEGEKEEVYTKRRGRSIVVEEEEPNWLEFQIGSHDFSGNSSASQAPIKKAFAARHLEPISLWL